MLPRSIAYMEPLDDLLKSYAAEPLPPPPERVNAGVWAEIERRRSHRGGSLFGWADAFLQPIAVAAALIIAVIIGFTPTFFRERPGAQQQLARQSLHLDVFSVHAASLGSSLFHSSGLPRDPR